MAMLGGSLAVPNVQEMVKQPITTIPSRFHYHDHPDPSLIISKPTSSPQVPIIDMHKLLSGDSMETELHKLHLACQEWGFFQLVNHGVSIELMEKVKSETEKFFNLPIEKKKEYWQQPGVDMEGFGQAFVKSEQQKLNWLDMFYIVTQPKSLRKPRLFPKLPTSYRDTMDAYSDEVKNLAWEILKLMAKALNMEVKDLNGLFGDMAQAMTTNYYPPCPEPDRVIGLKPHSDAGGLTILLQVGDMEGLQLKKDGIWIPVRPLPNAFILNIGDCLEIVTNGIYHSNVHRAVVNSVKERISIATFCNPKLDEVMGPAPSLITPQTPAVFKEICVAEYLKGFFSVDLKGRSYIDVVRVNQNENA